MSKKDFKIFAIAVSILKEEKEREKIIDFLIPIFRSDNHRFDEDRFKEYIKRLVNNESLKGLR